MSCLGLGVVGAIIDGVAVGLVREGVVSDHILILVNNSGATVFYSGQIHVPFSVDCFFQNAAPAGAGATFPCLPAKDNILGQGQNISTATVNIAGHIFRFVPTIGGFQPLIGEVGRSACAEEDRPADASLFGLAGFSFAG